MYLESRFSRRFIHRILKQELNKMSFIPFLSNPKFKFPSQSIPNKPFTYVLWRCSKFHLTTFYYMCRTILEPQKWIYLCLKHMAWFYSLRQNLWPDVIFLFCSLCRRSPGRRQCGGGVTPSCPGPGWRRAGRRADTWPPSPDQHRWPANVVKLRSRSRSRSGEGRVKVSRCRLRWGSDRSEQSQVTSKCPYTHTHSRPRFTRKIEDSVL